MGGIVARLALSLGINSLVDVVLTMSTPHLLPPAMFEYEMESIYRSISYRHNASSPLLFSLCGGVSDSQIVSDACALPQGIISPTDGFAVFTTSIPGTWTGADHQAMVWCHQVRWRVARVLLEMTRFTQREEQLNIAEKWLLGRSGGLSSPSPPFKIISVPVTSVSMSMVLSSPTSGFAQHSPEVRIQYCETEHACHDIEATYEILPQPLDNSAPFPLPGEGIKPHELAFAINMQLSAPYGMIKIYAPSHIDIVVGQSSTETVYGNSWGE